MERLCVYSRAVAHFPMVVKEANFVSNYVIRTDVVASKTHFQILQVHCTLVNSRCSKLSRDTMNRTHVGFILAIGSQVLYFTASIIRQ